MNIKNRQWLTTCTCVIILFFLLSCQTTQTVVDVENPENTSAIPVETKPQENLALLPGLPAVLVEAAGQIISQHSIDFETLQKLTKESVSSPIADDDFKLLHLYAMRGNDLNDLLTLISLDENPFAPESLYGASPLHLAAWQNKNPKIIEVLLRSGHPLDALDAYGDTPLHWATRSNAETEITMQLINAGFNPAYLDKDLNSSVHLAILYNKNPTGVLLALLKAGVSPDGYTPQGFQPIHLVSYRSDQVPELLDVLLSYEVPIDALSIKLGETALHIAAGRTSAQTVRYLLNRGANPNMVDSNGYTALHKAARSNSDPEVIDVLSRAYANIDLQEPLYNSTPLHLAASHNTNPAILRSLVAHGAAVNAQDNRGETPLHLAISYSKNSIPIIETLLALGADPFVVNDANVSAADLIAEDPLLYFFNDTIQAKRESGHAN